VSCRVVRRLRPGRRVDGEIAGQALGCEVSGEPLLAVVKGQRNDRRRGGEEKGLIGKYEKLLVVVFD
jgi:hypothetical protein